MKRDYRALSEVREASPFETPPRVLVVADDDSAREAVALVEALEAFGAEAEVRFSDEAFHSHLRPDAVIVAEPHGYRITRHHPLLEDMLRSVAL